MRKVFSFPFVMIGVLLVGLGMWIGGERTKRIILDSIIDSLVEGLNE